MKNLFTLLLALASFTAFGQTAREHFENGIAKHDQQDYKAAIKEYDKAIKADKSYRDAYYNRGSCQLAINELKPAMADFTKAIELDPEFAKAYYSRATVYASQNKFLEALPDLDKTIALAPTSASALNLRGQIRAQSGNKQGACEDFTAAKNTGDSKAASYFSQYCGNEQLPGESLMLHWPEGENWKVGNSQETEEMAVMELIHADETLENWTEFGYMSSVKGAVNVPMDKAMNLMFEQAKKNAPNAKLTLIEKNENAEHPWVLFTIEAPGFKNDKKPESQLYYIVQGKESLYINFRAVKKAAIPADQKAKWAAFFKTGKVIYK